MVKAFLINRWFHMVLLLTLLSGALYMQEKDYAWVKSLRYLAFDSYNRIYPRQSNDQVVIVDIDEASLKDEKLGQWPWPRTDVARLVRNLKELGAKAIVFDMVFAEEDRTSPSVLLRRIPSQYITPELSNTLNSLPDHDTVLSEAFSAAGNVVTGFVWSPATGATRHLPVLQKPVLGAENIAGILYSAPSVVTNQIQLETAAAGNGNFGQRPDIDGIIRRVPLLFSVKESDEKDSKSIVYPSLALEALRVSEDPKIFNQFKKLNPKNLGWLDSPYMLKQGKYKIPLNEEAVFYVHFSEFEEGKYLSAYKVIDKTIDPKKIKGKIVLVGTSSIGLKDSRATPLNMNVPGVEVHRNVIEQIIEGRFLLRNSLVLAAEFIFTGLVALAVIACAPFVNALWLGLFVFALIVGIFFFSFATYVFHGILIGPVYPASTIFLIFFLSSFLTYIRTEVERRVIKNTFSLYISPDYMKDLTKNPSNLRLGGEIRQISVMFTDIRGFTGISEKLTPNELIHLMNSFLTPMSDQVMLHRGTIDKYMGDAMMAFWNAPLDDPQHERNACFAALSIRRELEKLNMRFAQEAKTQGKEPIILRAGIGVNSGSGAVGNMGSRQRFAYSVLGDTVNLASRLEGQTKAYGVDILVGESTFAAIPDFAALELDLLRVKGKDHPVRVYTILGAEKTGSFFTWEEVHGKMLAAYRAQEWDLAMAMMTDCEGMAAESMKDYYQIMRERIRNNMAFPLSKDWDGVYVAASK